MVENNKELERKELHSALWSMACKLAHAGGVAPWSFKEYVFGIMFYRFISENLSDYINRGEWEAGNKDFHYAKLSDEHAEQAREDLIRTKGFFILPSQLFENVRHRSKNDENINETLDSAFKSIEASAKGSESEQDFKGLFDGVNVNSPMLGSSVADRNKKLVTLLNEIGKMQLGNYRDSSIDAFGDAYEYLMKMYAASVGQKSGQFFTPQEVSRLLTLLSLDGKKEVNKVYDIITTKTIQFNYPILSAS